MCKSVFYGYTLMIFFCVATTRAKDKKFTIITKGLSIRYVFHDENLATWHQAGERCAGAGAKLFVAEDEAEAKAVMKEVYSVFDIHNWVWTGISDLNKSDVYQTLDGRPLEAVHHVWYQFKPNRQEVGYDCVLLGPAPDHDLFVYHCEIPLPYVCKFPATSPAPTTPPTPLHEVTLTERDKPVTTAASFHPVTTPASYNHVTTPASYNHVTTPASYNHVTTSASYHPVTTPASYNHVTTPVRYDPVTTSASSNPVTTPARSDPVTTSAIYHPVTTPASYNHVTTPASYHPVTTLASYNHVTTPARYDPVTTSASYNPVTTPARYDPVTTSASYNPVTTPASYIPVTTPASDVQPEPLAMGCNVTFRIRESWYMYHKELLTWHQARHRCTVAGADFWVPTDKTVAKIVLEVLRRADSVTTIWTGIHNKETEDLHEAIVPKWYPGLERPSNANVSEYHCMTLQRDLSLSYFHCDDKQFPYMCTSKE